MTAPLPRVRSPLGTLTAALWGLLLLTAPTAQAAPFAYITNLGSNTVSVLDTATNTVTAIVPAGGGGFPEGIAVNPAGTRVYVTSYPGLNAGVGNGNVSVIATATNTVIATVPVGLGPPRVAVNPAATRVYVANAQSNTVSVIDAASNTVIATVPVGAFPQGLAVNPAGTRVYVANVLSHTVTVIDTATNTVIATVAVGLGPRDVALNPVGDRVYVTNGSANTVSVIDTDCNAVIGTVAVQQAPFGIAVNPAGTRVYVANAATRNVSVIDTTSGTVIATVVTPGQPLDVAVNPAGTRIYATNGPFNTVSVLDAATNTVIATVPVPVGQDRPSGIAFASGVGPPIAGPNLQVTGMEVTQGIQDLANSVPLVPGRRTFVRVYVQSDGSAVPGVTATLSGSGLSSCIGAGCPPAINLGPLMPVNTVGPRITVGPDPKRSNLNDSFLFELPWNWTQFRTLQLRAKLALASGLHVQQSCSTDVSNLHEFRFPKILKIQFIRLAYPLTGTTNAEASMLERDQSESFIRRTFPVPDLAPTRDARLFDAGLKSRVERTADECKDLKTAEKDLCAQKYITSRLAALEASTGVLGLRRLVEGPAGSTHHVGEVDGAYALIPQHPINTNDRFTRGACCNNRIGAGPSNDADYAAHEIGHLFRRKHPVQGASPPMQRCGHDAVDPDYPYFFSFIAPPLSDPATGLAGFDGGDASLSIPMSHRSPQNNFDIMGYCNPSWISDYTYRALSLCLREANPSTLSRDCTRDAGELAFAGPDGPQMGDWLMVFGNITSDPATAGFIQTQRVERIFSVPPRTPGNHSIRLIGAGGVTLADYPFAPTEVEDASSPLLQFGHVVPFVAGTREIQIVETSAGSTVIGAKPVSPNPPVISNVALQGAPDPVTGAMTVGWTASDPDGDPLTFDLFFTRDGGASLQPLMLGLSGTSAPVDTAHLSGGNAQFRVAATDGVQSAFADSPLFSLGNKPPRPRILTLGDGMTIHEGQLVNLAGEATDPQDGVIPDTGLAWSTQEGPLGLGARLSITELPVGVNRVTLTATNSLGLSAAINVIVIVEEALDLPGPTLTAGPGQIGWHVDVGEAQLQMAELDIGNSGSGDLEFTASSSAPWLTLSAATGTAPATLTLTADPVGFAGGVTEETEVTLTAVGMPGQVITVPVTLSVGNTFVVGKTTVVGDTAQPVVTPPADLTLPATEAGGARGSAAAALAAFLTGGSAVDAGDPTPTRFAPQVAGVDADNTTLMPLGMTPVTFRFGDASGNVGSATANVTVLLGQPRLSGAIIAKGVHAPGVLFIDLKLTNTGTGHARNLLVNQIALRTLLGSGAVTYNTTLSPALPNAIGNLHVGAAATLRLYLNVPSTVKRFSLTENGTGHHVAGTGFTYSVGQAVTP